MASALLLLTTTVGASSPPDTCRWSWKALLSTRPSWRSLGCLPDAICTVQLHKLRLCDFATHTSKAAHTGGERKYDASVGDCQASRFTGRLEQCEMQARFVTVGVLAPSTAVAAVAFAAAAVACIAFVVVSRGSSKALVTRIDEGPRSQREPATAIRRAAEAPEAPEEEHSEGLLGKETVQAGSPLEATSTVIEGELKSLVLEVLETAVHVATNENEREQPERQTPSLLLPHELQEPINGVDEPLRIRLKSREWHVRAGACRELALCKPDLISDRATRYLVLEVFTSDDNADVLWAAGEALTHPIATRHFTQQEAQCIEDLVNLPDEASAVVRKSYWNSRSNEKPFVPAPTPMGPIAGVKGFTNERRDITTHAVGAIRTGPIDPYFGEGRGWRMATNSYAS
ncbi:hypothetical protein AB1Y20_001064 [Prymnesium parvum]|uniref:Uncharacterized protein n=1 Tax=Prymnesium parvum TaxID=97485 RepID=A0AB34K6M8_PRYPA